MIENIGRIAGQLKEASLDPAGWETALDSINSFLNASGVILLSADERLRHAPYSRDMGEMVEDYFKSGWYANDQREECLPLLLKNGIVRDYEFMEMSQIDEYYGAFLARHDRKWFAGLGANLDGDLWCLSLQRSVEKGPFLDADISHLAVVQTQLNAAASYARIVSRQWLDGAVSALEGEGSVAIVLDRAGRVLQLSKDARSIVFGRANSARGEQRKSPRIFEDALRSTLRSAQTRSSLATRLPFEFDQKTYALEATSLIGKAGLVFSRASLLVRLYPPSSDPEQVLRSKYRLTQSETRVAMALAAGLDVESMAEAFKVSPNTIRAQLKAAYAKTETPGQARLVSFIAQLKGSAVAF